MQKETYLVCSLLPADLLVTRIEHLLGHQPGDNPVDICWKVSIQGDPLESDEPVSICQT